MYDLGKIGIGIIIFLALALFPVYSNFGKEVKKPEPKIDTPEIQKMVDKKCVESKEFMRAGHMQLLNDWRDSALREGDRLYIGENGKEHHISLQNSCMKCHSNKKKFCDECHSYAAVNPYCWDCHFVKEEDQK